MTKAKDIMQTMEALAPVSLAEDWDNVGLQVGHPEKDINRVLLALTATEDVVDEAINCRYDMILTHHPLIFSALKSMREDQPLTRILAKLIRYDIAHYCAHTNLDIADGGVNDALAAKLGLEELRPLSPSGRKKRYKLTVFVPSSDVKHVQAALFAAGAGRQGDYDSCSWQSPGTGSYRPLEGAQPAIGDVGKFHEEPEARLEVLVHEDDLYRVREALLKAHPYEEVAYDIFEEIHMDTPYGIGRIGKLSEPKALKDLLPLWSQALKTPLRYGGDPERLVEWVGLCGGSGQSYITAAAAQGCQVFLTGDVRYHGYEEALGQDLILIDAGHYASEAPVLESLQTLLKGSYPNLEIDISQVEKNLFQLYC